MYWLRILVLGTGEIIEFSRGFRTIERLLKFSNSYLSRDRDYDNIDEVYVISIYNRPGMVKDSSGQFGYSNSNPGREPIKEYRIRRDQVLGSSSYEEVE